MPETFRQGSLRTLRAAGLSGIWMTTKPVSVPGVRVGASWAAVAGVGVDSAGAAAGTAGGAALVCRRAAADRDLAVGPVGPVEAASPGAVGGAAGLVSSLDATAMVSDVVADSTGATGVGAVIGRAGLAAPRGVWVSVWVPRPPLPSDGEETWRVAVMTRTVNVRGRIERNRKG